MSDSTFRFKLNLPKEVLLFGQEISREDFFSWLWETYTSRGLVGVHEGSVLSEEAAEQGFETDSWTLDAAEAPKERDWVESQEIEEAELYFDTPEHCEKARIDLKEATGILCGEVVEQVPEDWNASWRASFNTLEKGFEIPPFWKIYPSWLEKGREEDGRKIIRINPGAGFGTGTHETTQLCLEAIGDCAVAALEAAAEGPASGLRIEGHVKMSSIGGPQLEPYFGGALAGVRALDFGSGSGILGIGAALLGARVSSVEIDSLAIDNALENSALNGVETEIHYTKSLNSVGDHFQIVIANILRPVLIEFAPELVRRLAPRGTLILSGLIENDVAEVDRVFSALLERKPEVRKLNEWRCLKWSGSPTRPPGRTAFGVAGGLKV